MCRHLIQKICLFIFFFCTTLLFLSVESYASNDIITVNVEGVYDNTSKEAILDRINEIRKEACDEELSFIYKGDPYSFTSSDYHPVEWSTELEKVTLQRAAESAVRMSHTRPNDTHRRTAREELGVTPYGAESLAWNYDADGIMVGIDQWYEEKAFIDEKIMSGEPDYNFGEEIGHYVHLINSSYYYTAVSGFRSADISFNNGNVTINDYHPEGMWGVAQLSAFNNTIDSSQLNKLDVSNITSANIGVLLNKTTPVVFSPTILRVGDSSTLSLSATIQYEERIGSTNWRTISKVSLTPAEFISDAPTIVSVDETSLTAISPGTATITGRTTDGKLSANASIVVKKPVESVSVIQPDQDILKSGETLQLEAIVEPDDATDRSIVWQTNDAQAASVDEYGMVTAKTGSATVTITAISVDDDTISDSISLRIVPQNYLSTPPTLSLLTQGDIYEGDPVTIRFDAVEGAVAYRYEIDGAGNDYTPTEPRQAYGLRFPSLSPGTHSIRMKAVFRDGSETDFSQPLPVTVKSNSVSGPVLTLLTSDPIYEDTGFDIRWTEVPNASYYVYNFEKASGNSTVGGSLSASGNALTHHFNGLPAGAGLYTLRIRAALNADGSIMSGYSNAVQVEIHSRPANAASAPVVTIRSTSTLTTDVGVPFSFTPVANAESYLIQIVTSDEKKELVYNSSVPNAGSYRLGPDKYEFKAGAYVMTITARLRDGSLSPESDGTYFWIVNPITEDGPTLRMQTQGTLREDTGFELAWTAVPNAFQYVIYTYDKATGHTESYHRVDGSKTTLKIDRHKAGTYRAYVYAMLDALGTTLSKNSNTIEFTVSERSSVNNNTSNTTTSQNTVSDPPKSVDNTPAPVAVSTMTTTPVTTNYVKLASTSDGSNAVQENTGETQNATRAGVMTNDKKQVLFFVFLLAFSLLMLRREMYQLQLAKLYHVLSYQLTAYQKRYDNKQSRKNLNRYGA